MKNFVSQSQIFLTNLLKVQELDCFELSHRDLGCHKLSTRRVPQHPTDVDKAKRLSSDLTYPLCNRKMRANFSTDSRDWNEIWVQFVNAETKEQSKKGLQTQSSHKPRKNLTLSKWRMMVTVLWPVTTARGILVTGYNGTRVHMTSDIYCKTSNKLRWSKQNN